MYNALKENITLNSKMYLIKKIYYNDIDFIN